MKQGLVPPIAAPNSDTMASEDSINGMAAKISALAEIFAKSLTDAKITQPTFSPGGPHSYENLTADLFLQRQELLDKITDMWYLVQGPSESVFNYVHTVSEVTVITALYRLSDLPGRLTVHPRRYGLEPHEPL
jgi:hypothetical protein